MRQANAAIVKADLGIAGTEPDGLLLGGDNLLYRPRKELAPAKMGIWIRPVAVESDGRLILENGLVVWVLSAYPRPLGETGGGAAGRARHGSLGQAFRKRDIGRRRVRHKIKDPRHERDRQP